MFLKEPVENNNIEYMANSTSTVKTLIGFCAIVTIFSIFFVEPLLNIISYYVQISGY